MAVRTNHPTGAQVSDPARSCGFSKLAGSETGAPQQCSRRTMIKRTGQFALATVAGLPVCLGSEGKLSRQRSFGAVIGEAAGAKAGEQVLREGGNAVDAAVAAALTSCAATPSRCGVGGYGGHMILALERGKKIACIDFNTMAPAAARAEMYPFDDSGRVKGRTNFFGWQAVGVPGTLAGLQLALERFGSRSLRELAQPAIRIAQEGFTISPAFANGIRRASSRFQNDPGSARLYLRNGEPLSAGEVLRNPDLAQLLKTLAERNSVDSFYRGDIAQFLAEAFQQNGGLVTMKDLGGYHAREVKPYKLDWGKFEVFTAPLTAGGLTVLEALSVLKALHWPGQMPPSAAAHAKLEVLRLAWKDRLELLGDPQQAKVPAEELLSRKHAVGLAGRVNSAVKARRPIAIDIPKHTDDGTVNLSCVDGDGNLVAVTLTHGGAFGAQVTVDGLGITLGHGMSRFDPHPGHPNSPGPGKRPLHNMCPSVVLREGKPLLAMGGAGGVKIPNSIFEVLTQILVRGTSLEEAIAAPRLHTTGTLDVTSEAVWPKDEVDYLNQIGFKVQTGEPALVSAVSFDYRTGQTSKAMR